MRTWVLIGGFLLAACTKPAEVGPAPSARAVRANADPRVVALEVTPDGFKPDSVKLKAHEAVKLVVTRTTDETCATDLVIDGTDIKLPLPLNKPAEVIWTPTKAGTVKFGCAMDMMVSGVLLVE